jgi:hypothetical protein
VSWSSRDSLLLLLAAAIFAIRATLALVIVPPWQHPDEPQNVALIRLLKEAGSARPAGRSHHAVPRRRSR